MAATTRTAMLICVAGLVLASAGLGQGRSVPVHGRDQGQLPPVPGYIPVYIQSGDSPPDVQRLYESHRTLALAAHGSAPAPVHAPAPAPAPSRRTALAEPPPAVAAASNGDVAAVPAPSARQPPSATRSRTPATHGPTHGPAAGYANGNAGRVTKKGAAGPVPAFAAPAGPAAAAPQHTKTAPKKRGGGGTRVQYQQQQKAAQTRKRQQQQRNFKEQQQQQYQPQR